mmetsp:Transcript_3453/g.3957  ORF Transcript_3453/g.3957 Transcript_3453/m.3957 type:complete len:524 (+) Transcript_3453:127-1698(+)
MTVDVIMMETIEVKEEDEFNKKKDFVMNHPILYSNGINLDYGDYFNVYETPRGAVSLKWMYENKCSPQNHILDSYMGSELEYDVFPRSTSHPDLFSLVERPADKCTVTSENAMQELCCTAQRYAWGLVGSNSTVARMKAASSKYDGSGFKIDESSPYAELWVGTHPNGMSVLPGKNNMSLKDYVRSNPQLHCGLSTETDVSFLFKVLSINKTLSIQAHPDKKRAERLHAANPSAYKDPNHKPEMAIALSDDFEAMCGFRSLQDIASSAQKHPEFVTMIGIENAKRLIETASSSYTPEQSRDMLQTMYHHYMSLPDEIISVHLQSLLGRLNSLGYIVDCTDELVLRLSHQHPGDSGIFSPYFFNHMKLREGDAFFIGANEPHAYISGEILECMACSDNVVRAGLTPKLKDIPTLVEMLTYKTGQPDVTTGISLDKFTKLYHPPVPDFAIEVMDIPPSQVYNMGKVNAPSVLLCLNGSGVVEQGIVKSINIGFGVAAFVSANTEAKLYSGESGVRIARAMTNVHL